jgi:manganese efflux pump family protein
MSLSTIALFTWIATVLCGIILVAIWLIEYDQDFQSVAATRLPVPVIASHATLGLGGLLLWAVYLLTDSDRLGWAIVAAMVVVASLGLIMAARWIRVYLDYASPNSSAGRVVIVPPERHFPRSVIIIHGAFAIVTVVLVTITVF